MSDSVRPHRRQPTRLPGPWDSPGKNTGVGCHFLLQCMKVKSESEVAQLCPTLSNPMDCSPPDSSVHGIFQARVLEWGMSIPVHIFLCTHVCIPLRCGSRDETAGSLGDVCLVSIDTDSFPQCFIISASSSKFQLPTSLPLLGSLPF